MKTKKIKSDKWLLIALFSTAISCNQVNSPSENSLGVAGTSTSPSCSCYSIGSLYNVMINFNNQVPGLSSFSNQSQADCFAWQEFISLNWPVNPLDSFGTTYDLAPVQ